MQQGEERNKQDVTFCLQLFNNGMHVGLAEEDFINVFRLGRINESDAPRPLMVQLASYNIKNLIMESLYRLQIKSNTAKANRSMLKRLRSALTHDAAAVNVHHRFVVKLLSSDSHQNHYIGPVVIFHCVYCTTVFDM